MIESFYWKEELLRIARNLSRVSKPRRLTERAERIIERDLMIGFFLLRRLIELQKVSKATSDEMLHVFSHSARGKNVTRLNGHRIWELYELDREVAIPKKTGYIANQFIHAYTSFIARDESRNWSDAFIVSDYDRNDCIWRIPICEVRRIFQVAAGDFPNSMRFVYSPAKKDYDVETN